MPFLNILEDEITTDNASHRVIRPHLTTFDSAPEFSLQHFSEIRKLVEAEDQDLGGYVFDDSCLHLV